MMLLVTAMAVASGNLAARAAAASASRPQRRPDAGVVGRRVCCAASSAARSCSSSAPCLRRGILSSLPPPPKALASIGTVSANVGPGPANVVVKHGAYRLVFHITPEQGRRAGLVRASRSRRTGSRCTAATVTSNFAMLDMEMPNLGYNLAEQGAGPVHARNTNALVMVGHWGLTFEIEPPHDLPFTVTHPRPRRRMNEPSPTAEERSALAAARGVVPCPCSRLVARASPSSPGRCCDGDSRHADQAARRSLRVRRRHRGDRDRCAARERDAGAPAPPAEGSFHHRPQPPRRTRTARRSRPRPRARSCSRRRTATSPSGSPCSQRAGRTRAAGVRHRPGAARGGPVRRVPGARQRRAGAAPSRAARAATGPSSTGGVRRARVRGRDPRAEPRRVGGLVPAPGRRCRAVRPRRSSGAPRRPGARCGALVVHDRLSSGPGSDGRDGLALRGAVPARLRIRNGPAAVVIGEPPLGHGSSATAGRSSEQDPIRQPIPLWESVANAPSTRLGDPARPAGLEGRLLRSADPGLVHDLGRQGDRCVPWSCE